jgi:putative pyruvate formate lyase activating enzyme
MIQYPNNINNVKTENLLQECTICPRQCKIDRITARGSCKVLWDPVVASTMVHFGEEPPISGKRGSGTIFFAGCSLNCVFCQNHEISQNARGSNMTIRELAKTFMELERKGVHNINLVTPSHFVPQIAEAIKIAKNEGINIPFIYNSSGYDTIPSLRLMEGLVDIYMPDLKYSTDDLGQRYSNVPDYFSVASQAIREMYRQVGAPLNHDGVMQKGLLIRHLLLPGLSEDSIAVLDWIKANTPMAGISLLAQYSPFYRASEYKEINRFLMAYESHSVASYLKKIGLIKI